MAATAVSDACGTTLPRTGYFWGTHPPRNTASAIQGELDDTYGASGTQVSNWPEAQDCRTPSSLIPPYAVKLLAMPWASPDITAVRSTAVASVRLSTPVEFTNSPWQEF